MTIGPEMNGLVFFTDFHAHLFMEFAKHDDEFYTDRFKEQCGVLERILKYAADNKYGVVFGGDLFHKRGAVDVRVMSKIYGLFQKYTPDIPHTYLLRGNHDSYDNSMGSVSSLDTFNALPHTQVISNPRVVNLADNGINLYFMPYGEDVPAMKAWLKEQAESLPNGYNVLVAHLGTDGARQGRSTHRLAQAFAPGDLYPDKFDQVYIGHIHLRQQITDNMFYGGSTMQLSFNDEGQEKGFDTLTGTTWEFHPIATRQFVTLPEWDDTLAKEHANDFVRLRVPEEAAKSIETTSNVRVEAQVEVKTETRIDINADDSPDAVVTKFMDKSYPDYKQLALDVLTEAMNG